MTDADSLDREPTPDEDMAILTRHLIQLREHFDSIEIIATRHLNDDDGTVLCHRGAGNWYARSAAIREWVLKADERDREAIRKQSRDEESDD